MFIFKIILRLDQRQNDYDGNSYVIQENSYSILTK